MRATALYTFASVITFCCREQPQDYTWKTRTGDTAVCLWYYLLFPTCTLKLLILPLNKQSQIFSKNNLWHMEKGRGNFGGGGTGKEGGITVRGGARGEKSHRYSHLPQPLHPIRGDFLITTAGVCPLLQQGEGKEAEAQPTSLQPAPWPSQSSSGILLSSTQDATHHLRPAPKDPAPIPGAVGTKSAALFSDTDVSLKAPAFQCCEKLTTPARRPVW